MPSASFCLHQRLVLMCVACNVTVSYRTPPNESVQHRMTDDGNDPPSIHTYTTTVRTIRTLVLNLLIRLSRMNQFFCYTFMLTRACKLHDHLGVRDSNFNSRRDLFFSNISFFSL